MKNSVLRYLTMGFCLIRAVSLNQCPRPTTTDHCRSGCVDRATTDHCGNIMSMLDGMDTEYRGLQLHTHNRLDDLDNKVNDILNKIDPCSSSPCVNGNCVKSEDGFKCVCMDGYTGSTCRDEVTATDCYDLKSTGTVTTDGVYKVKLWKTHSAMEVRCDMTTDGGGWTVFQNRFTGEEDFYRNFKEYEDGFGAVSQDFWLGLRYIEELASQGLSELRIELTAADGSTWFETYTDFRLSPEPDYHLHIAKGSNSSGGSNFRLMLYNGMGFTTMDMDSDLDSQHFRNDTRAELNCGILNHGGWWFGYCKSNHFVNLNGEYCVPGGISTFNDGYGGFMFRDFKGLECLQSSRMMIRRIVDSCEETTTR